MTKPQFELENMNNSELAELAASCLERLEPGLQPLPLFVQLARLVVMSTVEIVPFKPADENPKVLLAKRPDDDMWWPGQWHIPGTVLLPTDDATDVHDFDTPTDRLFKNEFHDSVIKTGNVNVFDAQRRSGGRGAEQTVFGWANIALANGFTEAIGGEFFDPENIEKELAGEIIIDGHTSTVKHALRNYKTRD